MKQLLFFGLTHCVLQSPTNLGPQDQHKLGNNAFTTPGTGNVSAMFPRSLSELSELSNAPSPRSISETSQFSHDKGSRRVNKALDGACCPYSKWWKRLRAKMVHSVSVHSQARDPSTYNSLSQG